MTLGNISRHVDAAEKEWQSLRARPLQGRKPVAGLFETDPENLPQPVDIVA
jgi:hypothetical protein